MSGSLTTIDRLSPAPILDAVDRYRGTIVDLDSGWTTGPDEFARIREELTVWLQLQGLAEGDRVAIAVPNGTAFISALVAVLSCGACPLLLHFKTPAAEIQRYARRFGCRYLINDPGLSDSIFDVTNSSVLWDCPVFQLQLGRLDCGPDVYEQLKLVGVPMHPTSGSTGLPKIALRPGPVAIEEARHYAETMSIGPDDTVVAVPPMSHAYGYGTSVMVPLLTGANILSLQRFSMANLHDALSRYPATILPVVPAMLNALAAGRNLNWKGLRWVLAAGSVLPSNFARTFHEKTGIVCRPLYGTTETGGISVDTSSEGLAVDGRVGLPMPGVEAKVILEESGDGQSPWGRLAIRTSSMMEGYLDERGNITRPFDDGWLVTGDLADPDLSEGIHLRGRESEVINVQGMKVVPCEVEEVLSRLPGIREVKVYVGEDKRGSQTVQAAVAIDEGLTVTRILQHCETHLVYYKIPKTIHLVEALPRNPAGKIVRDLLP